MAVGIRVGRVVHLLNDVTVLGTHPPQFTSPRQRTFGEAPGLQRQHALLFCEVAAGQRPAGYRLIELDGPISVQLRSSTEADLRDGDAIALGELAFVFTTDPVGLRERGGVLTSSEAGTLEHVVESLVRAPGRRRQACALFRPGASGEWEMFPDPARPLPAPREWLDRRARQTGAFELAEADAPPAAAVDAPRWALGISLASGGEDRVLVLAERPDPAPPPPPPPPPGAFVVPVLFEPKITRPPTPEEEIEELAGRLKIQFEYAISAWKSDVRELDSRHADRAAGGWLVLDRDARVVEPLEARRVYWIGPGTREGEAAMHHRRGMETIGLVYLDHQNKLWAVSLGRGGASRIETLRDGIASVGGRDLWFSIENPAREGTATNVLDPGWGTAVGVDPEPDSVAAERHHFADLASEEAVAHRLVEVLAARFSFRTLSVSSVPGEARRLLDPRRQEFRHLAGGAGGPPVRALVGDERIGHILLARKSYFTTGLIHEAGNPMATMYHAPCFGIPVAFHGGELIVVTGSPLPGHTGQPGSAPQLLVLALVRAAADRLHQIWDEPARPPSPADDGPRRGGD